MCWNHQSTCHRCLCVIRCVYMVYGFVSYWAQIHGTTLKSVLRLYSRVIKWRIPKMFAFHSIGYWNLCVEQKYVQKKGINVFKISINETRKKWHRMFGVNTKKICHKHVLIKDVVVKSQQFYGKKFITVPIFMVDLI